MCQFENIEDAKNNIISFINNNTMTLEELESIYSIIFYIYTEDYDLVCHCIRKLNNFTYGSLPCIIKIK